LVEAKIEGDDPEEGNDCLKRSSIHGVRMGGGNNSGVGAQPPDQQVFSVHITTTKKPGGGKPPIMLKGEKPKKLNRDLVGVTVLAATT
jgi:hypothetical protein